MLPVSVCSCSRFNALREENEGFSKMLVCLQGFGAAAAANSEDVPQLVRSSSLDCPVSFCQLALLIAVSQQSECLSLSTYVAEGILLSLGLSMHTAVHNMARKGLNIAQQLLWTQDCGMHVCKAQISGAVQVTACLTGMYLFADAGNHILDWIL